MRWNVERGRALTVADLTAATRLHTELHARALEFFDRYDYLACPVTQVEPFPVEVEYPAGSRACRWRPTWSGCARARVSPSPAARRSRSRRGCPANGLPVGLQLVARPFAERALLEAAHAVDVMTGYSRLVPPAAAAAR